MYDWLQTWNFCLNERPDLFPPTLFGIQDVDFSRMNLLIGIPKISELHLLDDFFEVAGRKKP